MFLLWINIFILIVLCVLIVINHLLIIYFVLILVNLIVKHIIMNYLHRNVHRVLNLLPMKSVPKLWNRNIIWNAFVVKWIKYLLVLVRKKEKKIIFVS